MAVNKELNNHIVKELNNHIVEELNYHIVEDVIFLFSPVRKYICRLHIRTPCKVIEYILTLKVIQ